MAIAALAGILGVGFGIAGDLYSGFSAKKSADTQASDLEYQGRILYSEAVRDAAVIDEEGEKFAQTQSLQYISSGVELTGSALLYPAQTRSYAKAESDSYRSRGRAQMGLAYRNAKTLRNEGRASLFSSIMSAGSRLVSFLPTGGSAGKTTETPFQITDTPVSNRQSYVGGGNVISNRATYSTPNRYAGQWR